MKIIVHNYRNQFALSRQQIEKIKETLPDEYFKPIKEFHLLDDSRNKEVFEYCRKGKIVWFSYPVVEKNHENLDRAIEELLIGIARIKSKSKFCQSLKDQERGEHLDFVKKWHQRCLKAASQSIA